MTNRADELLQRMQRQIQPLIAPDKPADCMPPEEVILNVMDNYGFSREKAIEELRKTGHY